MEKLKINRSDCARIAESVFAEPISVWVNCEPEKSCVEIAILSMSEDYDFDDRDVDLDEMPAWEREMFEQEWETQDILEGWSKYFQIEEAPSYESFRWMEDFVDDVVAPQNAAAGKRMAKAIGGRGTFSRFKVAAAQAGWLKNWYSFLNEKQCEWVADQFRGGGIEVVDDGGLPLVVHPELL